jgi:hypothetical protein
MRRRVFAIPPRTRVDANRLLAIGFLSVGFGAACDSVLGLDPFHVSNVESGPDARSPAALPDESATGGDGADAPPVPSPPDAAFVPEASSGELIGREAATPDVAIARVPDPIESRPQADSSSLAPLTGNGEPDSSIRDASRMRHDDGDASAAPDSRVAQEPSDGGESPESTAPDAKCPISLLGGAASVLFGFDDASSANGWITGGNVGGIVASAAWTDSDGHSCAGAIALTVPFYGSPTASPDLAFAFAPEATWNATTLHVWMKLEVGDRTEYTALKAVQLYVQSALYSRYSSTQIAVASTLDDGAWHEAVMNLQAPAAGPQVATTRVDKLGAALIPFYVPPAGSPPLTTATLLLDDVWLE